MQYIGVGRRFIAVFIDGLVGFVLLFPIAAMFGTTTSSNGTVRANVGGPGTLVLAVIWLGYMTIMEGTIGASLGKLAVGIRVVKEDGSKCDLGSALIREILRIIDGLFVYLVGAIFVWTSPTRQRLGDRAGKTVVIQAGSNQAMGQPPIGQSMAQPMQPGAPMPPPPPAMPPPPPASPEPPQQPPPQG